MKANELRIGNYIGDKDDIAIVESIDKDGCMVQFINDEKNGFRISQPIKPIPLTEEWLLRMGFDKFAEHTPSFGHDDIYRKGYIDIHARYNQYHFHGILINFVHELQNLYFALTKQELTMK
jgi:hypothetical protein